MDTMSMDAPHLSDEQLWRASREGDRDAFGRIVERYQSLICALAYSGTGNLAGSQDLAQETFVAAWRRLGELREPAKLRPWLCGIVRNLAANTLRRDLRRGGAPEGLEAIAEQPAAEEDPEAQAVTREEEALLWRALEGMPETYREPLVLFYREEQSVADVAAQLDMSEDAVKQRLSRGRAMLRVEIAGIVESALTRSRPGAGFTAAVLGALAVASPSSATAAAIAGAGALAGAGAVAGKGAGAALGAGTGSATATKTFTAAAAATHAAEGVVTAAKGALGGAATVLGPVAGLFTALLSARIVGSTARSEPERAAIARAFLVSILFCFAMVALLLATVAFGRMVAGGAALRDSPWLLAIGACVWTAVLVIQLLRVSERLEQTIARIRVQTGTEDEAYERLLAGRGLSLTRPFQHESRVRLLGLPLYAVSMSSLDAGAGTHRTRTVYAWIAVGDVAISPLLAFGGIAIAPVALGGVTIGGLSLSLFGCAAGLLAFGSLAAGWWALGVVAVAWRGAAGAVAIAHDYAIGAIVRAAEANSEAARAWFASQWFAGLGVILSIGLGALVLLAIVASLGVMAYRGWRMRR
jgi:RNA polymerase sigma factor (sigma-70 family)